MDPGSEAAPVQADIPQSQPLNGNQVINNAGGFVFKIDDFTRLRRFVILGSEANNYYVSRQELQLENCECVLKLLEEGHGLRVVEEVTRISREGRAPRQTTGILVLAVCARMGDVATRRAALAALPAVCRTASTLFELVQRCKELGPAVRAARAGDAAADLRVVKAWLAEQQAAAAAPAIAAYDRNGGRGGRGRGRGGRGGRGAGGRGAGGAVLVPPGAAGGKPSWGRAMRRAVALWYLEKNPAAVAYQATKYSQRHGWSHADLLRLAHPDPEEHAAKRRKLAATAAAAEGGSGAAGAAAGGDAAVAAAVPSPAVVAAAEAADSDWVMVPAEEGESEASEDGAGNGGGAAASELGALAAAMAAAVKVKVDGDGGDAAEAAEAQRVADMKAIFDYLTHGTLPGQERPVRRAKRTATDAASDANTAGDGSGGGEQQAPVAMEGVAEGGADDGSGAASAAPEAAAAAELAAAAVAPAAAAAAEAPAAVTTEAPAAAEAEASAAAAAEAPAAGAAEAPAAAAAEASAAAAAEAPAAAAAEAPVAAAAEAPAAAAAEATAAAATEAPAAADAVVSAAAAPAEAPAAAAAAEAPAEAPAAAGAAEAPATAAAEASAAAAEVPATAAEPLSPVMQYLVDANRLRKEIRVPPPLVKPQRSVKKATKRRRGRAASEDSNSEPEPEAPVDPAATEAEAEAAPPPPDPAAVAAHTAATAAAVKTAVSLVRRHRFGHEHVGDTALLRVPELWSAFLEVGMPLTALVRNLGRMTQLGLMDRPDCLARVTGRLTNARAVAAARLHPMVLLEALCTYRAGAGARGVARWDAAPAVCKALEAAFYLAFKNVRPTGQRYLAGLDVSGSMGFTNCAGMNSVSCRQAAAAMLMALVRAEPWLKTVAFSHQLVPMEVKAEDKLEYVIARAGAIPMGGTDCALPILYALERRIPVDVFVILTDNETWFGDMHPSEALRRYRAAMGLPGAKLVVMGFSATEFSIADPADPGMLDVAGLDSAVPQLVADFARGQL